MNRPYPDFPNRPPVALSPGFDGAGAHRRGRDGTVGRRFVTESHTLGRRPASPQTVLVAVAVAVAVFLIGRRLSA